MPMPMREIGIQHRDSADLRSVGNFQSCFTSRTNRPAYSPNTSTIAESIAAIKQLVDRLKGECLEELTEID